MTTTEIIIECAKLDRLDKRWRVLDLGTGPFVECGFYADGTYEFAKNYINSRDAIIPVIEKQPTDILVRFFTELGRIRFPKLRPGAEVERWQLYLLVLTSTARQLATALLKATGKWKD